MFARCCSLLLSLILLIATASASPTLSRLPRIIGGQSATNNEFGYVAIIQHSEGESGTQFLTGSLISPHLVLTEVSDYIHSNYKQPNTFHISFGHSYPKDKIPSNAIKASKISIHPDFRIETRVHSIAIITLESDVPVFEATPAKVYTGSFSSDPRLRVAGYGLTNGADSSSKPTNLMKVNVTLGSQDYCKRLNPNYNPDNMFCTNGTAGKDVCAGDWGGPLEIQPNLNSNTWDLLGFYSTKPNISSNSDYICGQPGLTSYYTYISPYVDWISRDADIAINKFTVTGSDNDEGGGSGDSNHSNGNGSDNGNGNGNSSKDSDSNGSSASTEGSHDSGSSKRDTIIGAVCGSIGGVLLLVLVFFLFRWYRRRTNADPNSAQGQKIQENMADEIGGAEAPVPINNHPIVGIFRGEDIVDYLPPAYVEPKGSHEFFASENSKVNEKD